eukprot:CAMPEP_0172428794 /NCGR_PEP_ID=MMETSP1064-20121228/47773_1 /TAXON_ID=202472 /ORGANISM="Aulacoseira subarctica , Strain CCAP 1002/5" /LENGTH=500 /DNA_ID=CAMNT_0013173771 /DNA_START=76 /DNA_END=1578 /DNA_ORIENTATION=+
MDFLPSVIRTTTGFCLDVTSNLLTRGNEHAAEKKLLIGGTPDVSPAISVYEQANPMLNISALIYIVCELRKVANETLHKFQHKYNLTNEGMEDLKKAYFSQKQLEGKIKEAEGNGNVIELNLLKVKYYDQLEDTKRLYKSMNSGITIAEMADVNYQFYLLSLPKTSVEVFGDIKANVDRMMPFLIAFGGVQFNVDIAESVATQSPDSFFYFVDEDFHAKDILGVLAELTWGITVSPKQKWISVVFRGSVTADDWIHNLNANQTDFILPGPDAKTPPMGKVEKGFYNYLFGKNLFQKQTTSKAESIMAMLYELFGNEKYKDYQLYVTGHSLGGSLSTLFAFRAAVDSGIPNKPVINVSFASPFVGDEEFRKNLRDLERNNSYRHLRISNEDDIVPLIPFMTLPFPNPIIKLFKQTGLNVRLYNKTFWRDFTLKPSYPKPDDPINELQDAISQNILLGLSFKVLPNHLCPEYKKRLDVSKNVLSHLNLENLYHNPYFTGSLF